MKLATVFAAGVLTGLIVGGLLSAAVFVVTVVTQ